MILETSRETYANNSHSRTGNKTMITFKSECGQFVASYDEATNVQVLFLLDDSGNVLATCRQSDIGGRSSFSSGFRAVLGELNDRCGFPRKFMTSKDLATANCR